MKALSLFTAAWVVLLSVSVVQIDVALVDEKEIREKTRKKDAEFYNTLLLNLSGRITELQWRIEDLEKDANPQ